MCRLLFIMWPLLSLPIMFLHIIEPSSNHTWHFTFCCILVTHPSLEIRTFLSGTGKKYLSHTVQLCKQVCILYFLFSSYIATSQQTPYPLISRLPVRAHPDPSVLPLLPTLSLYLVIYHSVSASLILCLTFFVFFTSFLFINL